MRRVRKAAIDLNSPRLAAMIKRYGSLADPAGHVTRGKDASVLISATIGASASTKVCPQALTLFKIILSP